MTDALDRIKAKDYTPQENIPYLEINDLMEFLAQQDEEAKKRNIVIAIPSEDSLPMFEQFLENVKTLSPAERDVYKRQVHHSSLIKHGNFSYRRCCMYGSHMRVIFCQALI